MVIIDPTFILIARLAALVAGWYLYKRAKKDGVSTWKAVIWGVTGWFVASLAIAFLATPNAYNF